MYTCYSWLKVERLLRRKAGKGTKSRLWGISGLFKMISVPARAVFMDQNFLKSEQRRSHC